MLKLSKDAVMGRLNIETFEQTSLANALSRLPKIGDGKGVWLAGGSVRRTFEGQKLDSDFDFFFRDEKSMDDFIKKLEGRGANLLKENDKNKMFILPSEVEEHEIEGFDGKYIPELKIQCINFEFFPDIQAVIDSFDFTICMFAFDGTDFFIGDFSLWDLSKKRLVINKISYAVSSMRRLIKYTNQGFTACGGCLTQLLSEVAANPAIINSDILYID